MEGGQLVHAFCVYCCGLACVAICCVEIGNCAVWSTRRIMEPNYLVVRPLPQGGCMDGPHSSAKVFRFGLFEANMYSGELRCDGMRIHLQSQPFLVLILLLERAGELVTREELRDRVWSENTFVEFDYALNTAIKKIRAVLRDDASIPRYVETVPRRGYRFIAPVSMVPDTSCRHQATTTEPGVPAHIINGRRERPLLIGMIVMAFMLGYLVRRAPL